VNRVPTKIFAPKREKVAGGCIKLRKGERHDFWASPNVIWVKESWRMRWKGHVACRFIVSKPDGKGSLGRPRYIDGKIILKLTLRRYAGRLRTELTYFSVTGTEYVYCVVQVTLYV
jgi:hypothetical protein